MNEAAAHIRNRPVFEIAGVSYAYPANYSTDETLEQVLVDIDLSVEPGETLGIVGESGSGKTTLLHLMSGYIPHFFRHGELSGAIRFHGEDVAASDFAALNRRIARVFQDPGIHTFGLTVEDALAFGGENLALSRKEIKARIEKVADSLGISHLLDRPGHQLSGGEQQRVAIAGMLLMDPDVILFDESISALDASGQLRVRNTLEDLGTKGQTMVVVDTDVRWLASFVNRLVVLGDRHVAFDGDPQRVLSDPDIAPIAGIPVATELCFREYRQRNALVEVENVSHRYEGGSWVLDGISLAVEEGSCTAFVGHNGSGKTTLAKVIAGLIEPTRGTARSNGQVLASLDSNQAVRLVGYVYQNPAASFIKPSVEDEFRFSAVQQGREPYVSLNQFGLVNLNGRTPWELSAGQQQRLAIAATLAAGPDVLILDEPTLGQTLRQRESLTELVYQLQRQGHTIILISHDMDFVARTSEYIHVLHEGSLVRTGATADVLTDHGLFNQLGLPLPWE